MIPAKKRVGTRVVQDEVPKTRVAAYCRVSTLLEEQEESLEAQVRYYTKFIGAHEDWEFAGIYSDEKSGTKKGPPERRPFFRLIAIPASAGWPARPAWLTERPASGGSPRSSSRQALLPA